MTKQVAVLGSTGSIGTQTLEVCRQRGYKITALTGFSNALLLARQAREFLPSLVVVGDVTKYAELQELLHDTDVTVKTGPEAILEAAACQQANTIVNAITGIAGLRPTLASLEAGKTVALANKEALIAGGALVRATAEKFGGQIIPVDSEHSAMWQSLAGSRRQDLRSLILTASGGPFFGKTKKELEDVAAADALVHPNWSMGSKITIDSATLMNKGLEFIEAMWFFEVRPDQIEVVVHRQSVLHSAVDFKDGTVIGQMSVPDMMGAIQYALTYPERPALSVPRLSLIEYGTLTFQPPDLETFTCLATCIEAAKRGGLVPCLANGANEQAVALFLQNKIKFLQIGELVAAAVAEITPPTEISLKNIELTDKMARDFVLSRV